MARKTEGSVHIWRTNSIHKQAIVTGEYMRKVLTATTAHRYVPCLPMQSSDHEDRARPSQEKSRKWLLGKTVS